MVNNRRVSQYRGLEATNNLERKGTITMKKITSGILGLSLTLATAGLMLAAQAPAPAPAGNTAPAATPTAKKHVKHSKKSVKESKGNTSAPAATPTK